MPRPATPVAAAARQAVLDRIRGRELLTGEYSLVLTSSAATAVTQAQEEYLLAEDAGDDARLAAAKQGLTDAWTELEAATVVLRFTGLPREPYRALIDAHAPTDEQIAEKAKLGVLPRWNADTFPLALIAATCTDPGFDSVEQVAALFASDAGVVSDAELEAITAVAVQTCEGTREVADWGKDSGETAV